MARISRELSLPVRKNIRRNKKRRPYKRSLYQALDPASKRNVGRILDRAKRRGKRG